MKKPYVCPCEGCKADRISVKLVREQRAARVARVAAEQALTPMEKNHMRIGAHVAAETSKHLDSTWTSQDGRVTRLQGMSMSHLLFAAAKMDREGRTRPYEMLSSEILRRLAHAYRDPNAAGNYRDPPGNYPR